ncbi:MAG: endonuclease/exonuclease/phosphatase family protein [Actinomycetota bacterium]
MQLRVMVWNLHGFRAGTKAMAEAVRAEEPDIVLLNETGYLGFRLRRFARRLDMEGSTGATLRWRIPNAALARRPWRVIRGQVAVFPRSRGMRRGVVLAQMGRSGFRLWVVAVHLGLSGQERATHAHVLTDLLDGRDPAVIGGDLNEDDTGAAARWISSRYVDAGAGESAEPTFPSKEPRARIDYAFVSEGIRVERAWTGGERFVELSDHRPVFADLTVG